MRYEANVRHAFIYERDAEEHESGDIWVLEAAAPRVQLRSYSLSAVQSYTLMRRRQLDEIGIVGRSRDWIFGDMIDAFRQAGGELRVGMPYDRGQGLFVHEWRSGTDSGFAQDFRGGELGEVALVITLARDGVALLTDRALGEFRAR